MNQSAHVQKYYRLHSIFYDATRWLFLFHRRKVIALMNVQPDDIVTDFACGTGLNIPLILKKTKNVTGIDFSEDMLSRAKNKYPNVQFIQGDICSCTIEQKADKIICTYSLSLIENWRSAVQNMQKHLKDSGTMVILDFGKWRGIMTIFYPLFKWWLNIHHVNPEMPVEKELKKYFMHVEVRTFLSGYDFIVIASNKKVNA